MMRHRRASPELYSFESVGDQASSADLLQDRLEWVVTSPHSFTGAASVLPFSPASTNFER